MQEILRDLQRYNAEFEDFRKLLAEAGQLAPERAEAQDETRSATAAVGRDGVPLLLRVNSGWQQRISPGELDVAVVRAFEQATARRLEDWSRLLTESGWQSRIDLLRRPSQPQPSTLLGRPATPERPSRSMDEVTEKMISLLGSAGTEGMAAPANERPGSVGTSSSRRVSLELADNGALVACRIHAGWASGQNAGTLSSALREALEEARRRHAARRPRDTEPSPLDALLGDAMSLLNGFTEERK